MMRTYVKGLIPINMEAIDKMYINDVDRVSPGNSGFLTDAETRVLLTQYEVDKSLKVRDELIHTFGRYVVSIAKNYQNQGLPLCDLIAEGMLGLMMAIDNFDLNNVTQFMTYANVCISRSMREALDQFNFPVKVPKNIRNQHRKVKTLTESMQLEGYLEDEIQDKFIDNAINVECFYNPGLFSKVSVGMSGGEDELIDESDLYFISDDVPDAKLIKQDLKREIARIFRKRLTRVEAKVLRLYFGIDQPYRIVSIADLGAKLGMSGERARQIREAGLEKLRADDCKKILAKYL